MLREFFLLSGQEEEEQKKPLQPSKNGNTTSGLIHMSFLFIEHLSFWGCAVFIN